MNGGGIFYKRGFSIETTSLSLYHCIMTQWWWLTFYIGLSCFTFIRADQKCGGGCGGKSKDSVYNFDDGTIYKYEVEGLSVTTLPGSSNDVSKLSITATAEISAQPQCSYVLKLSNVQVAGTDGKKYDGLNADCAKPVKFSFNNGQVSPELCTEKDDNGAALNIKRAVISLFQTREDVTAGSKSGNAYETDVFGTCPTNFVISKDGNVVSVTKSRNLNRCAHREKFDFPMLSTPYNSQRTDFQTSPLMSAELTVVQEIDNGILKKATGEEEYEYRPLLTAQNAAKIVNKFSLKFVGSNKGSVPANGNEQQSIIFESPHPSDGIGNAAAIIKALQKVVSEIEPAVDPSAADDFLDLVDVLEHGTKADILTVYSQIKSGAGFKDKEVAKNLLLDGLLFAGSAESVEAAAELLISKEISEASSLKWYLDLNFVKHVSKGSIKAVTPLLEGDAPHQAYLGIGALAGKYCRQHDCEKVPEFQQLLKKLAKPVFDGCKVSSIEQENNVIASLKGLANVQLITDDVAAKLKECAEDSKVKTRVRSAALSAYRTNDLLKKSAIKIFKNTNEDAELRIKAYLALVSCPCAEVADAVKETIDKEPVNQVGSYVVSHLRNLRATTNPDKEAAKHFLGEIIPKKRFPFDIRKFSHNRELSYSLDALNIGAVGEANTIYSQKSYLPRYVNLNLTSNIFGHSFNFLEVAARAENLEYILEKYFGPRGEHNKKSPNDVVEDAAEAGEKFYNRYQRRGRRSVSQQQINDVAKKVKFGVDYEDRSLDLDLSVKLFGAEVGWFKLNGDKTTSLNHIYNKMPGRLEEYVDKLRNYDVDYKKARTFLDATVTYPTALGLALKVKVLGGSAVNIKVDSKLDIKAIIQAIKNKDVDLNTDIKLQVIPSAAIEINSLIAIDADVVQTGVKVSANLHSSTGADITLRILDGSGIDLKVGLPVKNQELVSVKSSIVSIVREKGHAESTTPITFNTNRANYGGCFDQLSSLIGLTFCGEISVPTDGFMILSPAYGPSKIVLRLEKEDESLTSYHFKAYYNDKEPHSRSFELILDTPNSSSNRKLGLVIKGSSEPRMELSATAVSPWKTVSVEGFVTDSDKEQSLTAKLINDNQEYSLKFGAEVSGDANRRKYEPLLEYKEPQGGKQISLIGRKGAAKGGKSQQALGITGAVIVDRTPGKYRKYELKSVTVTTQHFKFTVDGDITVDKNSLESDLTVSYDKNAIKFVSKLQCTGGKYSADIDFVPQQQKEFGVSLKWNFEKEKHKFANNLVLIHGPDLKSEEARFSLAQSFKYSYETIQNFDFEAKNSLSYPLLGVVGKVDVEVSPKEIEAEVKAEYAMFNMEAKLDAKTAIKDVGDYNVEFSARVLENSVQLTAKHDIISDTKSKLTNSLELKPGGKYQLNAIVVYDFKGKDIQQSIDAEIRVPFEPKTIKLNTGVKNNKEESSVLFILIGGNKPIVEVKGAIVKSSKPEGNFKVYLPNFLESSGSYRFDGRKGVGSFLVELPKTGRQIDGKGEIYITDSNYKGFTEIQWDAKKNPSKKVRIETDSDVSENAIDSKNSFQVLDYKTTVNVKGQLDGKLSDGTITGEGELGLPSGRIISLKLNRQLHLKPNNNEIQASYELSNYESKGAQPQKLVFKISGKNIDPKTIAFDGQADLSYTSPKQETVVLHLVGKKIPQGDKWLIAGEGTVSGSLVNTLNLKLDSEVSDLLLKGELSNDSQLPPLSYHLTASDANSGVTIGLTGKANGYNLNNDLDLALPADLPVTSFKWSSNNYINVNPPQGQFMKVKYNNAITWNGNKFIKVNIEGNDEAKGMNGKLEWESHAASVRTLTGRVIKEVVGDVINAEIEGSLAYDGKKGDIEIKVNANQKENIYNTVVVANVPEKGKFTADLKHKESKSSETGNIRDTILVLTGYDKTVKITSYSEVNRPVLFIMKFLVEAPQGKSGIYVKALKKGVRHYDIEQKYNWISNGGGSLDLDVEYDFEDVKDLSLKIAANSPKLQVNNFQFDVTSKAAVKTSGKRIVFSAKTADKSIFSGSANYQVDDKLPNSLSLDGNGVLKVGDDTYPLKIKFDYDHSLADSSIGLNIDAKPFTWVSIIAKKDADMKISHKFCKNSICSQLEFTQVIVFSQKGTPSLSIDREIIIDLESMIADINKFNHKSAFKQEGIYIDHKVTNSYGAYKAESHTYFKEKEAGVVVTLPSRIIALEINFDDLPGKGKGLPETFDITFYPNKNNAQEKTSLSYKSDFSKFVKNAATGPFTSELRFASPGIRDMVVKAEGEVSSDYQKVEGSIDIDVFNKKPNKIVITYSRNSKVGQNEFSFNQNLKVYSKGQEIDIQINQVLVSSKNSFSFVSKGYNVDPKRGKQEGILKIEGDENSGVLLLQLPEGVIVSYSTELTTTKDGMKGVGNYEILGTKMTETIIIKNNKLIYTGSIGKDKLDAVLGFAIGQIAEYKAEFNNKPLVDVKVQLDDANFLKTTYNYDVDNIKTVIEFIKSEDIKLLEQFIKTSKAVIERVSDQWADRSENLRKSLPNFKPVFNAYHQQLKKLREEFENDENLKGILAVFKNYRVLVLDQVTELYQEATKAVDALFDLINEAWQKLNESFKKIIPKLSASYSRVLEAYKDLLEEAYNVAKQVIGAVLDELKKHDAEIKEIVGLFTDYIHEIGILISRATKQLQIEANDFIIALKENIKALPIIAMIKDKLKELKENAQLPEHAFAMYSEFVQTAKQAAPTPEIQALIESVANYVEKILRHQAVDDSAELKEIYKDLILAIRSLFSYINPNNPKAPLENFQKFIQTKVFQPFRLIQPSRGGIRLNLFSVLQSPDLPSLSEFYHTYKPTKYILDYFPPYKAYASYADSTEIVTFDGQQLSFKGLCGYILVQDYVDGNFSVAASLENGKVKSLVISDGENLVELQSDHSIKLNGKPTEYPVTVGDLAVWRKYHSVGLYTDAGLKIWCHESLEYCTFSLSGFYFGKTRGLLGTYNNEPYDDLTAPAGNVCGSTSEFGNAWKTSSQCSDVPQVAHSHVHVDECSEYFTSGSPLQSCFPSVDPSNYRKSCDHKVQEAQGDKKETLCGILEAYSAACLSQDVHVNLPKECISCSVSGQPLMFGDTVSVKTPQKSADIVIFVEELEYNEEVYNSIILPLLPMLTNDLKEKGITDVKFALIGYGAPHQYWPAHYTTNGEIGYKGKAKITFGKPVNETSKGELVDKLRFLKQQFDLEFGLTPWHRVIEEIMFYPFRAEAVKSVIGVYAKPCDNAALPISTLPLQQFAGSIQAIKTGVKLTLITPLKDLQIEGKDEKTAANVVGFDTEAVYMQGEAKRKILKGDEDAYKNLKYSPDRCIDFAQSINGAVFSSDNFIQGKPGLRKNFLQVLSDKITEDLTGVEIQQECFCELGRFYPITRCKVVSRKEKETLAKQVKGGVKG